MGQDLFGQLCALLSALTWASALVLFKRSGERITPIALNLFKNVVGLIMLVVTLAAITGAGGEGLDAMDRCTLWDFGVLALSGIIGIALADTVFFHALNLIGVGLISIVDCAYSPFVILFSWLMLAEKLTVFHYVGGALIIVGVFVASRHSPPPDRTRLQILAGMLLAPLAVGMMAFGIVIAKPILPAYTVMFSTTVRVAAGSAVLALIALLSRERKTHWSVFVPSASWKYAIPGSVLGAYMAMILWVAGFKYTSASVAAILNQTSTVFAIVLATIFLKEAFTGRKVTAVVLAMMGVSVVALNDWLGERLSVVLPIVLPGVAGAS